MFENKNIGIIEMRKELNEFIEAHTPLLPENSGIETIPTVGFTRILQRSADQAQLIKKDTINATDVFGKCFS